MSIDLGVFMGVGGEGQEFELDRPETKSWADVVKVAQHHEGGNDTVIRRFVDLYSLGLQWDWYEQYKEWLVTKGDVEAYNASLVPDGSGVTPEPRPVPEMPVRPLQESSEDIMKREYSMFREAAYGGFQKQLDLKYPDNGAWVTFVEGVKLQYPS